MVGMVGMRKIMFSYPKAIYINGEKILTRAITSYGDGLDLITMFIFFPIMEEHGLSMRKI